VQYIKRGMIAYYIYCIPHKSKSLSKQTSNRCKYKSLTDTATATATATSISTKTNTIMSSSGRATLRVKQEQTDNGGEEERDSKRPRTSTTNSNNTITGSDTTMENDVAAPSSTIVASQSNAATTTSVVDATVTNIENNFTSNHGNDNNKNSDISGNGDINSDINNSEGDNVPTRLPTKEEIKKELYKLVDTDHYSRDESLQALHRFLHWNDINDSYNDDLWFSDYFYNYAGLQIVLDFVEKFSNDVECVVNATLVVQEMVHNCYHTKHREGGNIIFNHGGIEILLKSTSKLVEGNLDEPKLKALENIWGFFDTIFYTIDADGTFDGTNIDTSSKSFKDRFYSIVDSCLGILTKLQSCDDQTSIDIMSNAFSILGHATKISTKMKDYAVMREIRNKGIIPKTLEVLKMDDDSWNFRDNKLLRSALRMLTDCILNDNNLLTQASDLQSLLPLLVVAIKKFPPGFWLGSSKIITVLEKATDTTENKLILEKACVLGSLVSLLEKNSTSNRTKVRVRNLVANICTR
jgi:hypothetical protein